MTAPRPHVMRVLTRLNVGGIARQELLAARLLGAWYESSVVTGTAPEVEGELTDPEVPLTRTALVRPLAPADDLRAFAQLRGILRARRPDIVHTHMAKAGALSRLAALTLRRRPRLVHTYHGHVLEGYFSRPVQRAFLETERLLARVTDVLVTVSTETRDELLDLGIGTPSQYRVIPLGLDLADHLAAGPTGALRRELAVPDGAPLLGSVGRLVAIKDHATMLEAMALLPDAHLVLAGDGDLRGELEDRVATLGLADRVHLLGWRFDLPALYADLDLALLTSRNEGTPVALIEAAATGTPAVATDVGGVRSVVEDDVTGLLVPAGDPVAVADAVRALVADPGRRRAMGDRARAGASRWSGARMVADLRVVYDAVLGARR